MLETIVHSEGPGLNQFSCKFTILHIGNGWKTLELSCKTAKAENQTRSHRSELTNKILLHKECHMNTWKLLYHNQLF